MSPRGFLVLKAVLNNLKSRRPKMPYYAVARGREVGVYSSWPACEAQVHNFKDAKFKKFDDKDSAWDFVKKFRYKSYKPESSVNPKAEDIPHQEPNGKLLNATSPKSGCDCAQFNESVLNKLHSLDQRLKALEDCINNDSEKIGIDDDVKGIKVSNRSISSKKSNYRSIKKNLLLSENESIKPTTSRSFSTISTRQIKEEPEYDDLLKPSSSTALEISDSPDLVFPNTKRIKLEPEEDNIETDLLELMNSSDAGIQDCSPQTVPYLLDKEDFVMVHTDGACPNNSRKIAKAGIGIWFNNEHPLNLAAPVKGRATNNVAELQAATVAAQLAAKHGIKKLCIITDSIYVIKCATEWITNWKSNNWKNYKGQAVSNQDEILNLEKACNALESVKWLHVKGHNGNHGNVCADALARKGAELYVPSK